MHSFLDLRRLLAICISLRSFGSIPATQRPDRLLAQWDGRGRSSPYDRELQAISSATISNPDWRREQRIEEVPSRCRKIRKNPPRFSKSCWNRLAHLAQKVKQVRGLHVQCIACYLTLSLLTYAVRNSQCLSADWSATCAEFGDCLLQHSEGQPPDPKSGGMVREAGEIHDAKVDSKTNGPMQINAIFNIAVLSLGKAVWMSWSHWITS